MHHTEMYRINARFFTITNIMVEKNEYIVYSCMYGRIVHKRQNKGIVF